MAASKGIENWNKHWKGKGNITTSIKVTSAAYYEDEDSNRSSGNLQKGTSVIYIDNLSKKHNRVSIQVGSEVYYTNIDNLVKPKSVSLINLKPQAFGLAGTEYNISSYITALKNSINSRQDIVGDLQEYLLALVDFANNNSRSFSGIDIASLPMSDIVKDFGEVIGPIYCIRRGLGEYNIGVSSSSRIFIPIASNEPLLDYYIITATNNRIKVSAKAKGTSNTLKVNDLVPPILNNPTLFRKYSNDIEFNIMRIIYENSMVSGPIKVCGMLGVISQDAVNSVSGEPLQIPNTKLFTNLIQKDARLKTQKTVSTKQISFLCEKEVINYSKQGTKSNKFTSIVRDVLKNEIYFVKLSISNGNPNFLVQATSGESSINNLYFRTKNGYDSKSDKLGFKL
jgi:hypothetical protein